MKIYTKTGDDGTTGLIGGHRVSKADIRLEAYGTVDELNSWIGLLRACPDNTELHADLIFIQRTLFSICSHLATDKEHAMGELPDLPPITNQHSLVLEKGIDTFNQVLPELKNFIIPGGSQYAAYCHIARTVCRRAERRVIVFIQSNSTSSGAVSVEDKQPKTDLDYQAETNKNIVVFINRLSDYLFTLARYCSFKQGVNEIIWKNDL